MPSLGGPALPSLSQIVGWDTTHLSRASADWRSAAQRWEDAFDSMHRGTLAPGGTVWEGDTADAAQERSFVDLVVVRGLAESLREAAAVARRGADQLDYLKRQTIESINEAYESGFSVAEDLSVIDTTYDGLRIAMVRHHAATIAAKATALAAADKDIAAKITSATAILDDRGFPESPSDVHALDFPLAPPPDPSYPVNDVVAEATDLDGNHVILRRGYYDGKRGFGWDKIFHKHGITNPNVFNDLISHSRPISSKDGELIYKVPINRARCSSELGGLFISCDDTGESLEMMIVVDTTQQRWDVPDGGQKGVITMYPLPGGDGVVEVQPNWTMAPPWVSNNVPIN